MNLREFAASLQAAANEAEREAAAAAKGAAEEVVDRLRYDYWKERSGGTHSNTRVTEEPDGATVTVDVDHASVLDEGAPPHEIRAVKAKALRLADGRFFKRVWHPGHKGFHFSDQESKRGALNIHTRLDAWARRRLNAK